MPGHNKTGRRKTGPSFVQLFRYMLESPAWKSLSPQERAILLEVARLYNGQNNGFLALGVRAAAEGANVNKDTAAKCFRGLVDRGFLELAQAGEFNRNRFSGDELQATCRATEWRLTCHRCDRTHRPASRAFLQWQPEAKARPKRGTVLSETEGLEPFEPPTSVPRLRTIAGGRANG